MEYMILSKSEMALGVASFAVILNLVLGFALAVLWVDHKAMKNSTHQITMLNPETKELEDLVPEVAEFKRPPDPEDQIPPMTEAEKEAFVKGFDEEYDNIT